MVNRTLLVTFLVLAGLARAQDPLAERKLGPAPGQLVARSELARATGVKVEVRWDPASGCPASIRFTPPLRLKAEGPEAAAREALERVAPLFGKLAHDLQLEAPEPKLRVLSVQPFGDERHVRFEQRLGDVPLDGARLVVSLTRVERAIVVRAISGRAYQDAPPALPAGTCPGEAARPVFTPRGGAWRLAWRTSGLTAGVPVEVLTADDGEELSREETADRGTATGTVYPRARTGGAVSRPLRDLTVVVGGAQVTTGERGEFAGATASLPAGLSGPHERVLPRAGALYPSSRSGALTLDFADGDQRLTEVNLFHHLVQFRRFAATIPGMPAGALDKQVVVLTPLNDFNAYASSDAITVEGRTFDYQLTFGNEVGLDAGIVAHERGHAVLYGLGVVRPYSGDHRSLHEGYADYLSAIYTGDPELRFHSLGNGMRSLGEDRVYPQHWVGKEAHESSLVFSGALWDARQAAGGDARLVDAAALRAVPAAVAGGSPQVRDVAREVLDGADAKVKQVLETALRLHGLLDQDGAAPVVVAPDEVTLAAGSTRSVDVRAWDQPERDANKETQVSALLDLPGFATQSRPQSVTGLVRAEELVRLELAPREGDVGRHLITITAQSALTGRTSVRTIAVTVAAADTPSYALPSARTLRAQVGQLLRTPLTELFDPLQGATPTTREPYRFSTSGYLSAGAAIVGSDLVLSAGAADVGVHTFRVHADPARTDRDYDRQLVSVVTVVVGDPTAQVVVHRPLTVSGSSTWEQLPPGQPVVVEAGGADQLALVGDVVPGKWTDLAGATLELEGAPAAVTTAPGSFPYGVRTGFSSPKLLLDVRPPADTRVTTWTFDVVLRKGTTELARRTLVIQVIRPTGNRPLAPQVTPVVVAPPVVVPRPPVVTPTPRPDRPGPTPGPGIVGILNGPR